MADPGQNENLKDLLGFDPNESYGESNSSIPKPKDERYGWPKNWEELFQKAAEKKLGQFDAKPIVVDKENLFAAHKNDETGEEMRTYYRFVKRERIIGEDAQFEEYSDILMQLSKENGVSQINFTTNFEPGKSSGAYFYLGKDGFLMV